jgi:hypothetical protein
VNFINIDNGMIQKAEEKREHKVKNMAECLASENSWRISENFEKNCKERCDVSAIENDFKFSMEVQSFADSCKACFLTKDEKSKASI